MEGKILYILGFSASLIQGLRKGFFMVVLPILLLEKDISFKKLAIYDIIRYSMSMKIFFGFIMDLYYFEKIGKYLTYVLGIGYIYPLILLALSTHINWLLSGMQVVTLTCYIFILMILMSMYKIVVAN